MNLDLSTLTLRLTGGVTEPRLVNKGYGTPEQLHKGVLELVGELAAKSPIALRGTKHALTYARDHTIADGLDHHLERLRAAHRRHRRIGGRRPGEAVRPLPGLTAPRSRRYLPPSGT